jgi:hypothetical protein
MMLIQSISRIEPKITALICNIRVNPCAIFQDVR